MKLDTEEIRKGRHNGKFVWICDYRWKDFNKRPNRNVKPTKVLIRDCSETYKRVNYSNSFFSEIKKDKVVNSSVIKLFDNTGWRSFTGIALNVFTEEGECVEYYEMQRNIILKDADNYKNDFKSKIFCFICF